MKHLIFSIYDQKAKAYLPPFFLPNAPMAERVFGDCVNSESHQFAQHPEDYTLFTLGSFDDNNGEIDKLDAPTLICNALQVRRADKENPDNVTPISNDTRVQQDSESGDPEKLVQP